MQGATLKLGVGVLVACAVLAACGSTTRAAVSTGVQPTGAARAADMKPVTPDGRYQFVAADVHFMTGMISHHAQAVVMAGWAPTHAAATPVRLLCERIVVGQGDEIKLMQTWLRDRKQPVPAANALRMKMMMNGMEHDMLMPGMLSDEEMAQLDKARGPEFDRLFIEGMIKHHYGAITMVDEMFGTPGAGQDEIVFRFASDVYADQTTEIERMQKMLTSLQGKP